MFLTNTVATSAQCLFTQTPAVVHCRMQRLREGVHIRTMKAKRKVEEISKEDVQAFLKKNAFVLFTVGAVIVGGYASAS